MLRFNPTKFRELRELHGYAIDLAKKLHVSRPAVTQWESGKSRPEPKRYAAIAAALHCQVSDFCDEDAAAPPPAPADEMFQFIAAAWPDLSFEQRLDLVNTVRAWQSSAPNDSAAPGGSA